MSPTTSELGARIRNLRLKAGLSMVALEELSKVAQPNISLIERGGACPHNKTLKRLAGPLKVCPKELIALKPKAKKKKQEPTKLGKEILYWKKRRNLSYRKIAKKLNYSVTRCKKMIFGGRKYLAFNLAVALAEVFQVEPEVFFKYRKDWNAPLPPPAPNENEFSTLIKTTRLAHHLRQCDVAVIMKMTRQSIGQIESGQHVPLDEAIELFAEAFELDVAYCLALADKDRKYRGRPIRERAQA